MVLSVQQVDGRRRLITINRTVAKYTRLFASWPVSGLFAHQLPPRRRGRSRAPFRIDAPGASSRYSPAFSIVRSWRAVDLPAAFQRIKFLRHVSSHIPPASMRSRVSCQQPLRRDFSANLPIQMHPSQRRVRRQGALQRSCTCVAHLRPNFAYLQARPKGVIARLAAFAVGVYTVASRLRLETKHSRLGCVKSSRVSPGRATLNVGGPNVCSLLPRP